MKQYIALLFISLSLLSCGKNKKVPKDHLPPALMGKILMDVQTAEVYSTMIKKDTLHRGTVKNEDSLALYYKDIFVHYNITEQQFNQSLEWYKHHPGDLDSVYTHMLPELSKMEGIIQAKK